MFEREIQHIADLAGQTFKEPDMGNRSSQFNMTKTLTSHLGLNDLDPALFTYHPAVFHPLVLTAVTLVILDRAKDLGTEKSLALRLKGPMLMVSGFFTSPLDQSRIFSGEDREILTLLNFTGFLALSKKLKSSSTVHTFLYSFIQKNY